MDKKFSKNFYDFYLLEKRLELFSDPSLKEKKKIKMPRLPKGTAEAKERMEHSQEGGGGGQHRT